MSKSLKPTQFGNPILRQKAQKIPTSAIASAEIQELIHDMRHTLIQKKLGVGLAAPQVGKSLQLAVIAIRPSEYRPKIQPFTMTMINPEIIEQAGRKKPMWEGCISGGAGRAALFAKVPRYPEIQVRYYDEQGKRHTTWLKGLPAQVVQHEVDHLNGILFVDRVKDTTSYTTFSEYLKLVKRHLNHQKGTKSA